MSDTKETGDKMLRAAPPTSGAAPAAGARKTLTLTRTVEQGAVRQTFGQGRSKSVQVEVKKTRKLAKPGGDEHSEGSGGHSVTKLGGLSNSEMDKRLKALEAAKERDEVEAKASAEAEERRRLADEEVVALRAAQAKPQPGRSEPVVDTIAPDTVDAPVAAPIEAVAANGAIQAPKVAPAATAPARAAPAATTSSAAAAASKVAAAAPAATAAKTAKPGAAAEAIKRADAVARGRPGGQKTNEVEDDDVRMVKKGGIKIMVKAPVKAPDDKKERVRLTINNAFNEQERERSMASLRRKREREKLKAMGVPQARDKVMREVIIPEAITIQDLANRMTERAVDVIKLLMKQGVMHKINDVIDADTAELIVTEFGHTPKRVSESDVEEGFIADKDVDDHLEPRAPVVTWATSTTARHRCSTQFGRRTSCLVKPVVSRSTSVPIR